MEPYLDGVLKVDFSLLAEIEELDDSSTIDSWVVNRSHPERERETETETETERERENQQESRGYLRALYKTHPRDILIDIFDDCKKLTL